MAKLITKWRYLKPDAARHAQAYIRYIATREGVEKYVEELSLIHISEPTRH